MCKVLGKRFTEQKKLLPLVCNNEVLKSWLLVIILFLTIIAP